MDWLGTGPLLTCRVEPGVCFLCVLLYKQRFTLCVLSVVTPRRICATITYVGKVGLCRFFQMNPTAPATIPKSTSITVNTMAAVAPAKEGVKIVFWWSSATWCVCVLLKTVCRWILPGERALKASSCESQRGGNQPGSHWHWLLWLHTWRAKWCL